MKKLALAALAVLIAGPEVVAQEPVTLGDLYGELTKLVEDGGEDRNLEELSIVIGPKGTSSALVGTLQLTENEGGSTTITVLSSHQGACPDANADPALLNNLGFYIIQFCAHPTQRKANGDFHRLAGASGGLGALIGSQVFNCSNPYDYLMMSQGARGTLCN